jgi:iron complex outermembrane recepter protein
MRLVHRLSILAASVALPLSAHAQSTVTLDTVVVEGAGGSGTGGTFGTATGPVDGYVATQTQTGSKISTPLIELPQSISVVTTQQMEDRGVQNIGEALNYTSGVVTQPFGNDPRFFAPIIRGFAATDSLYINGFRFIRDFGALAFEPYGFERIEVLKGPASVLYGQGAPGGIINLVQKRPTFTEFRNVEAEIGNNSRYVAKFDVGGVYNEDVSYRMVGLGRLSETQMNYVDDDRVYLAPSISFRPDADTSFTLMGSLQYDKADSPVGLPQAGTLDGNPYGRIPPSLYLGEPDFNDSESWFGTIGYEFSHRFNEAVEFRQNAQYTRLDFNYQNLYFSGLGADNFTVARGPSVQDELTNSFGIDNQVETKFETGALQHTALIGLDYRQNNLDRSSNFSGTALPINAFDPVYGTPVTVNPDGANLTNVDLKQTGIYAQDQIRFDRLVVTAGLRQDWSDLSNAGGSVDDDALTGRAGAVYLFDNGLAPFISYATSFNPITGETSDGALFKPSEGKQVEGGIKYQPAGWNSFITASLYQIEQTNVVANQAVPDGGSLVREITQTGEIRSRGFELEATASLTDGLSLVGNYTYSDVEITQGDDTVVAGIITATTTGNRPANVPEHAAALWLDYAFQPGTVLEGVSLGGGVRYIGSRFGNNANSIDLPSATLVDLAIRYEKDDFKAALNVNNVADEEYVASCNFGCFYGEGRSVIASVAYKW